MTPPEKPPVLAQCYYVGLNPRWVEIADPMVPQNMPEDTAGGYEGVYSVYSGGALRIQERVGWGDEPRPQFRVLVTLGGETYHVYAHDVAAMMAVVTDWAGSLAAMEYLRRD